jgi:hypothetical protein
MVKHVIPTSWANAMELWDRGELDDESLICYADQCTRGMSHAARLLVAQRKGAKAPLTQG